MNFSEINTPSQLFEMNSAASDYDKAIEAVGELSYKEAQDVALHILQALGTVHQDVTNSEAEEGNTQSAIAWAKDEAKIHMAYNLVKDVDLD